MNGKVLARISPSEPWGDSHPRNHELLTSMHDIICAKDAFHAMLVRANTTAEVEQIRQMAEDITIGFAHLAGLAQMKRDKL